LPKDAFEKLFSDFRKDIDKYTKDTPKIFEKTAKKGAIKFVNTAKKLTDEEKLVNTGNYKRNWYADATGEEVYCENSAEYASHLEWGHKTRNGGRVKGHFVGQRAIDEAQFYCLEQLQDELDKLIK